MTTSPDLLSLRAGIAAAPTDTTARLAYASYLEEHCDLQREALAVLVAAYPDDPQWKTQYADWLAANVSQVTCPTCKGDGDGVRIGPDPPHTLLHYECRICKGTGTIPDPATLARVELIRVAVELAPYKARGVAECDHRPVTYDAHGTFYCGDREQVSQLVHRTEYLKSTHADSWRKAGVCEVCAWLPKRGGLFQATHCDNCFNTGDKGGLMQKTHGIHGAPDWVRTVDWSTGFPVVSCWLAECVVDDKPTKWLRAVCAAHDGASFKVVDREPFGSEITRGWLWFEGIETNGHAVHRAVFDWLPGYPVPESNPPRAHKQFPTAAASHAALGWAVGDFGRYGGE